MPPIDCRYDLRCPHCGVEFEYILTAEQVDRYRRAHIRETPDCIHRDGMCVQCNGRVILINCLAQDGRITVALVDGSNGILALGADYVAALVYPNELAATAPAQERLQ